MCGILGYFCTGNSSVDRELWQRLVALLGHRGPDDSTFWDGDRFFFGHRRLSIIDLSQGHQPMATADGALVVTFNGEIYNYIELRAELEGRGCRFLTQSDTEVLLHGYREWGVELPSKLLGMFAFAIADRRKLELFCARDRFGEKPFLYVEHPQGVAFASELKVLAALPATRREVNELALASYLCLNYVPGTDTLMRGVVRLQPGTWRLWSAGGSGRSGVYWRPPDPNGPDLQLSISEAVERLEPLIDASARLALRSDVPVGIFLSGGIDSSLIAESAARSGRLAAAYCLTFSEASYSEWPRAEQTARHLGLPLTEVRLGPEALDHFVEMAAHADDPLADSSALAVWTLSREVARHVKVVLSGDGGDELFGGYLTYQASLWHEAVTSRLPMGARRFLAHGGRSLPTSEGKVSATYKLRRFLRAASLAPSVAHFSWNGTWLPEEARTLVTPELRSAAAGALDRLAAAHRLPDRPSLRALQTADATEYLPNDILTKSDRMSMAHGLEVRSPFLDRELATFALRLPAGLKVTRWGVTKRVLRELATRKYNVAVGVGAKQGFSIPVHAWLRGRARPLVEDLLSPSSVSSIPFIDPRGVAGAVADHMAGRRSYGFELWGLAVLAAWHRTFVASPIAVPDGPRPRPLTL
ncbi:MAG: asparagine synthase (glutamine-hydrolyzing) [Acidobacteria bacterium]|nr:MAG: asparagine synthase (glutamine-hydrolyzing) [Acidobacteriota bacterium]PYR49744.1 MAG: asparagine synthase (glutamine-hydrolyzing) [Acidobacteriota bacterium]